MFKKRQRGVLFRFQKIMLDLSDISPGLTDSFKIGLLDATIEGSKRWKDIKNNLHSIAKATEKPLFSGNLN